VIWLTGFWASMATMAYVVALFPGLVLLRGLLRPGPEVPTTATVTPSVSIVIAARNEAGCIRSKIERLLALHHPCDLIEVIVASDGSDDGTDGEVTAVGDERVRLLSLPRAGKAAALNAAVAEARGEVLVFTDANSWFADGALQALLAPFADPAVGGVAGDQRYVRAGHERSISDGERAYWSVERAVKAAESRAGSTISATGAIYAVRRELVGEVPPDVTDDFYISTGVIAAGRRLVFAPAATAYEEVAGSAGLEYSRKVRVMTRGLTAVRRRAPLLDPRHTGFYALQLLTHKVLRRLMAVPALGLVTCGIPLMRRHVLYRVVVLGGLGFAAAGAVGTVTAQRRDSRLPLPLALPAYACLCHVASLRACWNVLRGRSITHWEPPKR